MVGFASAAATVFDGEEAGSGVAKQGGQQTRSTMSMTYVRAKKTFRTTMMGNTPTSHVRDALTHVTGRNSRKIKLASSPPARNIVEAREKAAE